MPRSAPPAGADVLDGPRGPHLGRAPRWRRWVLGAYFCSPRRRPSGYRAGHRSQCTAPAARRRSPDAGPGARPGRQVRAVRVPDRDDPRAHHRRTPGAGCRYATHGHTTTRSAGHGRTIHWATGSGPAGHVRRSTVGPALQADNEAVAAVGGADAVGRAERGVMRPVRRLGAIGRLATPSLDDPTRHLARSARRGRLPAEGSGRQMSPRRHRRRSAGLWSAVAPAADRVVRRSVPSERPAPQLGCTTVAASRLVAVRPGHSPALGRPVGRRSVGHDGGGPAFGAAAEKVADVDLVHATGEALGRSCRGDAGGSTEAVRCARRADRRRRLSRGSHTCIADPGRTPPPRTTRLGAAHDAVVRPNPTSSRPRLLLERAAPLSLPVAPDVRAAGFVRAVRSFEIRRPLVVAWWPTGPCVGWPHMAGG